MIESFLRASKGVPQLRLARETGLAQKTISRLRAGSRPELQPETRAALEAYIARRRQNGQSADFQEGVTVALREARRMLAQLEDELKAGAPAPAPKTTRKRRAGEKRGASKKESGERAAREAARRRAGEEPGG